MNKITADQAVIAIGVVLELHYARNIYASTAIQNIRKILNRTE